MVEERQTALDWYAGLDPVDVRSWERRWLETYRGTADAELVCPLSGWRFREHIGRHGEEYRLKRRPMTAREDYLIHDVVRDRVDAVGRTMALVDVTCLHRDEGRDQYREWYDATVEFHVALDELYSPDFTWLVWSVPRREPIALEAATVFLEVDPWCFRSGYFKEKILCRLARVARPALDEPRLQRALVDMVAKGPRSEWRAMRRLAWHLRSAAFLDVIAEAADAAETGRARAALTDYRDLVTNGTRRGGRRRRRRSNSS